MAGIFSSKAKPQRVDWLKMQEASERARLEEARVTAEALDAARRANVATDPIAQLVERCSALEARVAALESARTAGVNL